MEVHVFFFDRVSGQRDITLIANSHKLMNWSPLWFLSCVNVNQIHGFFFSPLCCRSRARMRHALHGLCVTPQNNLKICQVRMNPVTPIYKNFWDIWKQWNSECIERNYLRSRAECLIVTRYRWVISCLCPFYQVHVIFNYINFTQKATLSKLQTNKNKILPSQKNWMFSSTYIS